MLSVRPKVAELTFQLYGRPLHPELFQIYKSCRVKRSRYQAQIDITGAGHLVTLRQGGVTLTEVAATADNPLPTRRRLLFHRLRGERSDQAICRGGIEYQMNFALEKVESEIFWATQQDLVHEPAGWTLLHSFDANGRLALGARSFIRVEALADSLTVHAFHTFPDESATVKSQSLFRLPNSCRTP